jgi:SAM-dependent methyltransferase
MEKRWIFSLARVTASVAPRATMTLVITCVGCGATPASAPPASTQATASAHEAHHGGHAHGHPHRFDDAAHWSKIFDDPERDAWQKPARVVEVMGVSTGMQVADVGAGTGYFLPHLAKAVGPSGKVIGEDIEPDMIRWMSERAQREKLANVEARLGSADDPKLGEGALDRVLIVDTWHHVEQREAFARKLAAALRPGGAVFIVDFTRESPHGLPPEARLPPEAVASDLSAAGFTAAVVRDAGLPHQYVVRGERH